MKRHLKLKCVAALFFVALGATGVSRLHQEPHFRVLLIGIGPYNLRQDYFSKLSGDQDMAKLEAVIKSKFPQADIDDKLCHEGAATKAAIQASIKALAAKSQAGDAIYIAFAGHGTQVPDKSKATGRSQAFVPYDVQVATADDPDKGVVKGDVVASSVISGPEFNSLIKIVRDKVIDSNGLANITLTFDCCHSGSISRGSVGGWVKRGRQNPAVDRADSKVPAAAVSDEPEIKGLICLSAAQAGQSAWENGQGGLFTNGLLDALRSLNTSTGGHSYQSLFATIRSTMANVSTPEAQVPDLMGSAAREVFTSKTLALTDGYLVVTPPDSHGTPSVKMLAGAAFGIHTGDVVGIFKPGTEDPQTTPLARGTVSNAGPASSFVTLDGPARTPDQIKALGNNIALVLKAAPAGQLKIAVNGTLPPDIARSIAAQPDMELVGASEGYDVEVDAPASGGANGPAAAMWTINVTDTSPLSIPASEFDEKVLDDLRMIQRFRAVQAFGSVTQSPEVIVEMRLVPIAVDSGNSFTGLVGQVDVPLKGPVNSKTPFMIQVRAYSLNGSKHVPGKFNPYIALINSQPNWVVHQVWPGASGSVAGVQPEDAHLVADDKWRTLGAVYGLLPNLTSKERIGTFGCDETDGLGSEYWEIVATPTSIDYNPFLAAGASKSVSRGGGLQTPNQWSTTSVMVTVVKG